MHATPNIILFMAEKVQVSLQQELTQIFFVMMSFYNAGARTLLKFHAFFI